MAFNFIVPLRIAQVLFAILVLGLSAYGMLQHDSNALRSQEVFAS